ncbi:MAG: DUF2249 domain-containing protein [Rhodothermus sp.]|nr:DUF2249 domain-containing protein [Rhodothermus sp.]
MKRNTSDVVLDVRPVAPRTIMDTYRCLVPGEVLELVVDHEPSCMYYTLLAQQGARAFRFTYLERGPERRHVRVEKRQEES